MEISPDSPELRLEPMQAGGKGRSQGRDAGLRGFAIVCTVTPTTGRHGDETSSINIRD